MDVKFVGDHPMTVLIQMSIKNVLEGECVLEGARELRNEWGEEFVREIKKMPSNKEELCNCLL